MIRRKLQQFMYGRYGSDQLNNALLGLYLVLYLLTMVTGNDFLYAVSLILIGFSIFRLLSRNHGARRKENALFMSKARPFIGWFRTKKTMMMDHDHRYFKCPKCGQQLRVPKGRGAITVSCRSCGAKFKEKS